MTARRSSTEPLLWLLFSAGGVLAALLLPILLLLFGVAFPLHWIEPPRHGDLLALLRNPLTRVALALTCVLALFHWAHRFRYTLYDGLQLKHLDRPIRIFCYGGAILGSIVTCYVLFVAL
jgi:succinate dehydrogenase subunit D